MARVPAPLPLTDYQLKQRVKQLKKEGKPLTMTNIDPKFMRWVRMGQEMDKFTIYGLIICFIFFILAILIPKIIFLISEIK